MRKIRCLAPGAVFLVAAALFCAAAGAGEPEEPQETPLHRIPRLDGIAVDGEASDWGERGFRVLALAPLDGQSLPTSDFAARFRIGWDADGVLLLVRIRDDRFVEHEAGDTLWQRDSVEIYLADARGGEQMVQIVVAPGMTEEQPALRRHLHDHRKDASLREAGYRAEAARTPDPDGKGYTLEVRMPWEGLGVTPRAGRELGMQLMANDVDDPEDRVFNSLWYPGVAIFMDRDRLHRVALAEEASPPAAATARAEYSGLAHTRVRVVADESLAGTNARVVVEGAVADEQPLLANGGQALATLRAPVPPAGDPWKTIDVYAGERLANRLAQPDATERRERLLKKLPFVFDAYCFTGNRFPAGAFRNPVEAENVFGPHTARVRYYDAGYAPVTAADAPGRYGAVVTVDRADGDPVHRYATLLRLPEKPDWDDLELDARIALPEALGLPAGVVAEQQAVVADFAERLLRRSFREDPASAVVLAWLNETAPGTVASARNGPAARDRAWTYELRRRLDLDEPYPHVVYTPKAAEDAPADRRFPLIIHLHGSGGCKVPLERLRENGVVQFLRDHPELPFFVVTPHCPEGEWWQTPKLDDLYDEVTAKLPVDPDRVYLTGYSLGGFGTWMYAAARPDRLAAAVPICGGGDPDDAPHMAGLPIWIHHGAKDGAVPPAKSEEMAAALREAGGRVRLTIHPDAGHAVWPRVHADEAVYAWLLEQTRGNPAQPRATPATGP